MVVKYFQLNEIQSARIHITGIVQGVGFRPFVYGLAARLNLPGWVRNTSAGVDIEVDGAPETLQAFALALRAEAPPLARVETLELTSLPAQGFTRFEIVHSEAIPGAFQPISPDVCICDDCLRELFDPHDRRYRYPFINCTNCGPRFTIITDIPYDRPNTTMASFPLCPDCAAEYADPLDRRFHAQPVACPVCGPRLWLELTTSIQMPVTSDQLPDDGDHFPDTGDQVISQGDEAILKAQKLVAEGKIIAVKGLGGFHLACDATNAGAVTELRRRKLRVDKPFALMMSDIETVGAHCYLSEDERQLLTSRQRPIVVLRRKANSEICEQVAPRQATLGVMLPYTPLHYLLLSGETPKVWVMTSANLGEEPIVTGNHEARRRLASLADYILMHNRPIRTRCDDSLVRSFMGGSSQEAQEIPQESVSQPVMYLRRSRGFAPSPVTLPFAAPPLLAAGAELKNTFCLTRDQYAFLSHHIGDLENYETLTSFEDGIRHFERMFRIQPQVIAYDLHPNYLATRYAQERASRENLPAVGVQHHHAHIAACMADNNLPGDHPLIGLSFDGTGYGADGAIWGGEALVADYAAFRRAYHLAYVPLPGGDAAVRKPARTTLAYLRHAGLEWESGLPSVEAFCAEERQALSAQIERRINAPLTSSMGRFFDGVSALIGVRQVVNYEAQAAIELEALADPHESGAYPWEIRAASDSESGIIDPAPLIQAVLADYHHGVSASTISARFHNSVAEAALQICLALRQSEGLNEVALSGGVWQNVILLEKTVQRLKAAGFKIYLHRRVPANDGGLALGQAVVGAVISSQ